MLRSRLIVKELQFILIYKSAVAVPQYLVPMMRFIDGLAPSMIGRDAFRIARHDHSIVILNATE